MVYRSGAFAMRIDRSSADTRNCRRRTDADIETSPTGATPMCRHRPPCPSADAPDRAAALPVPRPPGQGWTLPRNGVLVFDDTGEIRPDGRVMDPHRPEPHAHSHVGSAA